MTLRIITCTVCSREKSREKNRIPARHRYLGTHIKKVAYIANRRQDPLFILSGVYGLVHANELVPFYDHLLQKKDVADLAIIIRRQFAEHRIEAIEFYFKKKESWEPYLLAIEYAAEQADIILRKHIMSPDD